MKETTVDWSLFTIKGEDNGKYILSAPCVIDGFKYATDGRIMIRVKTDEQNTDAPFPNPLNFSWGPKQAGKWFPPLKSPERTCERCDGGGRETVHCGKCQGEGVVQCYACEEARECKDCIGKGCVPTSVACKTCKGSGKIYYPEIYETDDFSIAGHYGFLITSLAGAKYYAPENKKTMLHFSFDGGEGFLMPIGPHPQDE